MGTVLLYLPVWDIVGGVEPQMKANYQSITSRKMGVTEAPGKIFYEFTSCPDASKIPHTFHPKEQHEDSQVALQETL